MPFILASICSTAATSIFKISADSSDAPLDDRAPPAVKMAADFRCSAWPFFAAAEVDALGVSRVLEMRGESFSWSVSKHLGRQVVSSSLLSLTLKMMRRSLCLQVEGWETQSYSAGWQMQQFVSLLMYFCLIPLSTICFHAYSSQTVKGQMVYCLTPMSPFWLQCRCTSEVNYTWTKHQSCPFVLRQLLPKAHAYFLPILLEHRS